ncbi:hypothetical protein VPH35_086115 [Triticum aestivum]
MSRTMHRTRSLLPSLLQTREEIAGSGNGGQHHLQDKSAAPLRLFKVNGVYLLLCCHVKTLLSLEFIHCQLYPAVMDKVCISLCQPGSQNYKFQSFYSSLVIMLIFLPYVNFFVICRPSDNLCMFI